MQKRVRVCNSFKEKEIELLRESIRNKISGTYDKLIARASSVEWKNLSAPAKCSIQSRDNIPTSDRRKLIAFVTDKSKDKSPVIK